MTRRTAVLAALVVGLATVAVAAGTWVTGSASGSLQVEALSVPGTAAAPAVVAGGLVTAAAGLALSLGGRGVRVVTAVVLAGSGVLVGWSAVAVLRDPLPAAQVAARDAVGMAVAEDVGATWLPWLAVALAVATVGLAGAALGRWQATSRRHEGPTTGPADPLDTWDALSRGEDPSAP